MNRSSLLTFVFAIVAIVIGLASAREAQYFYNSVSGEVLRVCFVWCSLSAFVYVVNTFRIWSLERLFSILMFDANTTKLTLYTLSFSTQIRIKQATWTDPLIAPWIDEETGKKYWTTADGTATWESPGNWKEEWSTEHKMPFYVNKKTSESTWDLPDELAWERVNHEVEDTLWCILSRECECEREGEVVFVNLHLYVLYYYYS